MKDGVIKEDLFKAALKYTRYILYDRKNLEFWMFDPQYRSRLHEKICHFVDCENQEVTKAFDSIVPEGKASGFTEEEITNIYNEFCKKLEEIADRPIQERHPQHFGVLKMLEESGGVNVVGMPSMGTTDEG